MHIRVITIQPPIPPCPPHRSTYQSLLPTKAQNTLKYRLLLEDKMTMTYLHKLPPAKSLLYLPQLQWFFKFFLPDPASSFPTQVPSFYALCGYFSSFFSTSPANIIPSLS